MFTATLTPAALWARDGATSSPATKLARHVLEDARALGLVSVVTPFSMGLLRERVNGRPDLASMSTGGILWLFHDGLRRERFLESSTWSWSIAPPLALCAITSAPLGYGASHRIEAQARTWSAEVA